MARWSVDAASGARARVRELAGELGAFLVGIVVLCGAVGIQGAWFTPEPAPSTSVISDQSPAPATSAVQFHTLFWTVFTGPEWPGADSTR